MNEGDELTLNCTAKGIPTPNVTWTRLSDNNVVSMPPNISGKVDDGYYRCSADNGFAKPVPADVLLTVKCECYARALT